MEDKSIYNRFLGVFSVWKMEIKKVFQDEGIILFFIVVPLLYPLLYASLYAPEVVTELPVAVVDNSNTSLSREYIRKVDATADVAVLYRSPDLKAAQELMKQTKIYGIIYIPEDFSKIIAQGEERTYVSIFSDMGSLLYYKAIMIANTEVSLAMNKEIKLQRAGNLSEREQENYAYPIAYEHVTLFNPQNGFASFLLPAVLILILHQTLLLGIGLRAGTEREQSRYHNLIPLAYHKGTLRLILHLTDILLFLFPFLIATTFFAMTLSVFVRNRETCIILFVFTSVPLLFISGISWPASSIAPFWKYVSYLFPSTLGINGFVRLNNMGAHLHQVRFEYIGLWLQSIIYFITTFIVYRREMILSHLNIGRRIRLLRAKRK